MKRALFTVLVVFCSLVWAMDHGGGEGQVPQTNPSSGGTVREDLVRRPYQTEWCPNTAGVLIDLWELKLIELTNKERKHINQNLPLLEPTQKLMDYARAKAATMAENRSMSHDWQPTAQSIANATGKVTQENIAMQAVNVTKVIEVWIASTHHHANMLAAKGTTGMAVAWTPQGVPYWAQIFQ